MNDIISLTIATVVLAVCIFAYYRSRYWARRAETAVKAATEAARRAKAAADESNLAYFRAHDSAMEAEQNANRAEDASRTARKDQA